MQITLLRVQTMSDITSTLHERCRTDTYTVGVSARLEAQRDRRAAMDDVARATTDSMMREATAAAGGGNPDVKLLCECPTNKACNDNCGQCIVYSSAQVPRGVRQERPGYAGAMRGAPSEPIVSLPCVGRRRELRACYIRASGPRQKASRNIGAEVF